MNVAQLRKALEGVPDHMDVFIEQTNDEYEYSLVSEAKVKKIPFYDGAKKMCSDKCFAITDNI